VPSGAGAAIRARASTAAPHLPQPPAAVPAEIVSLTCLD
jgi:hypothetical protein